MAISALKNFIVYVDGVGYAGRVEQGNPPKIAMKVEEYHGAGMLGPVDIPMDAIDKLGFEITLVEHVAAIERLFGTGEVGVTFRGAAGSANTAIVIETRALLREIDPGTWEAAKKGGIKLGLTASYYKKTVGGDAVLEIDVENFVWKVGGTDLLASMRAAFGLS